MIGIVCATTLLLAACSASAAGTTTGTATPGGGSLPPPTGTPSTTCASAASGGCALGAGAQSVTLAIEPDAGDHPIVDAINGAQHSIWMEMYLLTETSVIDALENAANRGLDVRVMIEAHPYGSGSESPQQLIAKLNAAGVHAQPTNPTFALTHAKLMIVDNQTALISSANYTKTALGGSSYGADRDYIVTDTDPADVSECAGIFQADWNRVAPPLPDPNLVVSPINARAKLLALISHAHATLHMEEEEMSDPAIIQALIAAAQGGVSVEVVVPTPSSGSSDASGEQQLTQGGVHVVTIDSNGGNNLYIHAKMIVADGSLAYVGSENVSTASLDENREVGVVIANTQVIQQLDQTFTTDFQSGSPAS